MITSNQIPLISDVSDGFFRRIIFLVFRKKIAKRDSSFFQKQVERELAGILNWALEGLIEFNQEQCLLEPECSRKIKKNLTEASNNLHLFMDHHFTDSFGNVYQYKLTDQQSWTCFDDFYKDYERYVTEVDKGVQLSSKMFSIRFKETFLNYPIESIREEIKPQRVGLTHLTRIRIKD